MPDTTSKSYSILLHAPEKAETIPSANPVSKVEKQGGAQLFDSKTIDSLEWPDTEDGAYAKKFLTPLVKNGISHYINNIQAEIFVVKVSQFVLPVIVTAENYDNSWVCSPYAHYIAYGKEHVSLIENRFLSQTIYWFLNGLGKICKMCRINSVAYVNNWLFATDLYPAELYPEHITAIMSLLEKRFPNHAIAFRSLNRLCNGSLIQSLNKLNFHLIASRQVYLTDTKNDFVFHTRIHKSDLKLWRDQPYTVLDGSKLTMEDCFNIHRLYHLLFTGRSNHQPQFKKQYFELMLEKKLLQFIILKSNGAIIGVAGYYVRNATMYCPILGYDKEHPEHTKIYRVLSTALILEAQKRGLLFHQSAGASFYKQIRRAESCLESTAVYSHHLPLKQRISWAMLSFFINTFAPKFMKKY